MHAKVSMFLAAICLVGCGTQPASAPAPGDAGTPLSYAQPAPEEDQALRAPRACQLGKGCLTLDPRPFELCLLSTKTCGAKGAESLRVVQPPDPATAPAG